MDPWEEPFRGALNRVINRRTTELGMSPRTLSEKLGPGYRRFMYWLEGRSGFPAALLPKLCRMLEDYELLDRLEREAGRISYHVPELAHLDNMEDARAVQRLMKEVGEALETLADTLEDGIVEKHELDVTLPALDDVIRECARLKHYLEKRHHADFSKKSRTSTALY